MLLSLLLSACQNSNNTEKSSLQNEVKKDIAVSETNSKTDVPGEFNSSFSASDYGESLDDSTSDKSPNKFKNYSFSDFIENFSPEKTALKRALTEKLFDLAVETSSRNSYSMTLKTKKFTRNNVMYEYVSYKDGDFRHEYPLHLSNDIRAVSLYKFDDNALYAYEIFTDSPEIEKRPDFILEGQPKYSYLGAIGTLLEFDPSIYDPDKISWEKLDDKIYIYYYKRMNSVVIENYIDPVTGFLFVKRESQMDNEGNLKPTSEMQVEDFILNPSFKSDAFELPKNGTIIESTEGNPRNEMIENLNNQENSSSN